MQKWVGVFLYFSLLFVSFDVAAAAAVDHRAIFVEVKDDGVLQTMKLPISTNYRIEPAFALDLQQKLKAVASIAVEKYYYLIFEKSLAIDEASVALRYVRTLSQVKRAYFEPTISDPIAYPIVVPHKPKNIFKSFTFEVVPNFESKQIYLDPAPTGLDARFAWTLPGGDGSGIRFADVETGWFNEHREFNKAFYDNGKNGRVDHGTAVWGIVAAHADGQGTTGIVSGVDFATCATGAGLPTPPDGDYFTLLSRAIGEAVAQLRPGDVLLVEQHQPGPDNGNYAPVEVYTPVFELLKAATDHGIHCVEAAGNGGSNLDGPAYQGAFDRKVRDSGCIIVGAGGSPEGSTPLQRLYFSDYGSRVDAFAYGELVTTTGYGDLFGADNTTMEYTSQFNGTSSATPMVASVVASIAGIAKAKGQKLTPAEVREALHKTGTAQKGDTSQNIGHMPDLHELVKTLIR